MAVQQASFSDINSEEESLSFFFFNNFYLDENFFTSDMWSKGTESFSRAGFKLQTG